MIVIYPLAEVLELGCSVTKNEKGEFTVTLRARGGQPEIVGTGETATRAAIAALVAKAMADKGGK